jgi:chorismate dehydratase
MRPPLKAKPFLSDDRLRIGEIPYANLFPVFYMLRKGADVSAYEFIEGVPADLNKKIREGLIDVSPSSSIEYLRHRDKYDLIADHSISATGPVGSIILFSKKPIEKLGGAAVLTSSQSETSVALLRIVLNRFYGLDCSFRSTRRKLKEGLRSNAAYLLIGDEALIEARQWPGLFLYDLGELWHQQTGLPFTFALWISRKDVRKEKKLLFAKFIADLDKAKTDALKQLDSIAAASPLKDLLSRDSLISYWEKISFDFRDKQKKGLERFREYSKELGLL